MTSVLTSVTLLLLAAIWNPVRPSAVRFKSWACFVMLMLVVAAVCFDSLQELLWSYSWLRAFGSGTSWDLSVGMTMDQSVAVVGIIGLLVAAIFARGGVAPFAQPPLAGVLGVVLLACGMTQVTLAIGLIPLLFAAYLGRGRGHIAGLSMGLALFGVWLSTLEGHGGEANYIVVGGFALCLGLIGASQGRAQDEPGIRGMLTYLIPLAGVLALISQTSSTLNQEGIDRILSAIAVGAIVAGFVLGHFERGVFWLNDIGPFALALAISSGRLFAPSLLALLSLAVVRGLGGATIAAGVADVKRRRAGWTLFFLAHFLCLGGLGGALHGNLAMLAEQAEVNRHTWAILIAYGFLILASARAAARIYKQSPDRAFSWRQVSVFAGVLILQLAVLWSGSWIGGLDGSQAWSPPWAQQLAPWGSEEGQITRTLLLPAAALLLFLGMYFLTLKKEVPIRKTATFSKQRGLAQMTERFGTIGERLSVSIQRAQLFSLQFVDRAGNSFGLGLSWLKTREASATAVMIWLFCVACVIWIFRTGGA